MSRIQLQGDPKGRVSHDSVGGWFLPCADRVRSSADRSGCHDQRTRSRYHTRRRPRRRLP